MTPQKGFYLAVGEALHSGRVGAHYGALYTNLHTQGYKMGLRWEQRVSFERLQLSELGS